jgi:hypothetical protein
MGSNERFDGFDFLSGTRGAVRLGKGQHLRALEAAQSNSAGVEARGYHAASPQNGR